MASKDLPFATPWGLYVLSLVVVAHQEITRGMLRLMAEDLEVQRVKRDNTSKKKQQRRKKRK